MSAKKKSKTPTRRRRRMSGVGTGTGVQTIIGLVIGGAGGRMLATAAGAKLDPKIISGLKIVGGYIISAKSSHQLVKGVGYGLVADGVTAILQQANVIRGIDDYPVTIPMAGTGYMENAINGGSPGYVNNMIAGDYNDIINGMIADQGTVSGGDEPGEYTSRCSPSGSGLFTVNPPVGMEY